MTGRERHPVLVAITGTAVLAMTSAQSPARPMEAFLYIEDHEVRKEVLAPLTAIEAFLPLDRADPEMISVEEQGRAAGDIATWFALLATVRIDGVVVDPDGETVVYFDRDIEEITGDFPREPIAAADCLVGIIHRFPSMGPPASVSLEWDGFTPTLPRLRLTAFPHDDALRTYLYPSSPEFTWRAEGRREASAITPPEATGPTGGWFGRPPAITEDDAGAITRVLLQNTYRAFHYRREERIYDALERTVGGGLLADVYLSIRSGLEVEAEGGAIVRIDEVTLEGFEAGELAPSSFTGMARWTVKGRIEHWGHVHERRNRYDAEITASIADDHWLLTGLRVTGMRRLETRLLTRSITGIANGEGE